MAGYPSVYLTPYGAAAGTWLSFDPVLSRVIVSLSGLRAQIGSNDTATLQRSVDQLRWTTIRGGSGVTLTSSAPDLSDYEFAPDAVNYYRAVRSGGGIETLAIATDLGGVPWLKSIRYPFLNLPVQLSNVSDIVRPAGPGSDPFLVLGESDYRAIAVMRGSRQFTVTVAVEDDAGSAALATLLETGDTLLLQTPADYTIPITGYYYAGDTVETRQGVPWSRRWIDIPCVEVIPPDEAVTGPPGTWATVVSSYATWAALVTAQPTWADVGELIGAPSDVVVS